MRDLEISKELLIEVLGSEYKQRLVDWFQIEDDNFLRTYYDCGSYDDKGRPTGLGLEINIYEFAFMCKEWVNKQEYWANSGYDNKYYCMLRDMPDNQWFYADTEVEAIFKACEWLLENKDNK